MSSNVPDSIAIRLEARVEGLMTMTSGVRSCVKRSHIAKKTMCHPFIADETALLHVEQYLEEALRPARRWGGVGAGCT